ncbi:hypothetical protein BDV93DRAFT_582425 [Ceratobasidium sp. AG-I]|nr:hypothetical protein BDV93DRAFT_582425 [Ceratobasidium sp. AG-I]
MKLAKLSQSRLEYDDLCVAVGNAGEDDDQLLPAYNITKGDMSVECWIPAVPGSRFCIHLKYNGKPASKRGLWLKDNIYLDGFWATSVAMEIEPRMKHNETETIGAKHDERDTKTPFRFEQREVIGGSSGRYHYLANWSPAPKKTIQQVDLYWVRNLGKTGREYSTEPQEMVRNHELIMLPIPEEKIKIQHEVGVVLGDSVPFEGVDGDIEAEKVDQNVYSFMFRYASEGYLLWKFDGLCASNPEPKIKQTAAPNCTFPPAPSELPTPQAPSQKRRNEINVDASDEDEKPRSSVETKRRRTKKPRLQTQLLTEAMSLTERHQGQQLTIRDLFTSEQT